MKAYNSNILSLESKSNELHALQLPPEMIELIISGGSKKDYYLTIKEKARLDNKNARGI